MGNFWSQPIRVECKEHAQLITSRTINSALWFVNNPPLERRIYAFLAKYAEKYSVKLYAFILVGNHYHLLAKFPHGRRSEFFRDFNARIAEAVKYYVPQFPGGPLFERRFTAQVLPLDEDVFNYFFYCALQCVSSGLCSRISDYPAFNFFNDAARGVERKFKLFNYGLYNAAKRHNAAVSRQEYMDTHTLKFESLPGQCYKTLSAELERRRLELVQEVGGFAGRKALLAVAPGSVPQSTKSGGIRPLVLSVCEEAKKQYLEWYFAVVDEFREAVFEYRLGLEVEFPEGTFRPPGICISP